MKVQLITDGHSSDVDLAIEILDRSRPAQRLDWDVAEPAISPVRLFLGVMATLATLTLGNAYIIRCEGWGIARRSGLDTALLDQTALTVAIGIALAVAAGAALAPFFVAISRQVHNRVTGSSLTVRLKE